MNCQSIVLAVPELFGLDRYERRVGRMTRAIVDAVHRGGVLEARTIWQADDIDGLTRATFDGVAPAPGSLIDVAIERVVDDYDFDASLVRVVSSPVRHGAKSRALRSAIATAESLFPSARISPEKSS